MYAIFFRDGWSIIPLGRAFARNLLVDVYRHIQDSCEEHAQVLVKLNIGAIRHRGGKCIPTYDLIIVTCIVPAYNMMSRENCVRSFDDQHHLISIL